MTFSPLSLAKNELRRRFAADPLALGATVINIEDISPRTLVLDLDDGQSIRIDLEVYSR